MTDATRENDRSSPRPRRKEVFGALGREGRGPLADVGGRDDDASGGILAASRRRVLAAAGLVGTGLVSGCAGLLTGGPVSAEATPAVLPSNHVRPTGGIPDLAVETGGFRQRAWARRARGTHSVDVAGRSVRVETENWGVTYQRAIGCDAERVRQELGCESEFVLGETVLLSTPSVEVLGCEVNPVDDVSPREVADALGGGGRTSGGPRERFATGEFEDPAEILRFSYGGTVSEVRNVQLQTDGWETESGERGSVDVARLSLDVRLRSGQETAAEAGLVKTSHDGTIVLLASWGLTVAGASGTGGGGSFLVSDPGDVGDSPPINLCGDCDCEDCCEEDNEYGSAYPCLCGCVGDNCLCDAAVVVGPPPSCRDDDCGGYLDHNVFGPVEEYNAGMWEAVPERVRFAGFQHAADGGASLEVSDGVLVVSRGSEAGEYGVSIDIGERRAFTTERPLDPARMPAGSYVESRFTGVVGGEGGRSLGRTRLSRTDAGFAGMADYSALGVDTYSVEIRDGDRAVGEASGLVEPTGFGAALAPTTFRCCCDMTGDTWEWYWRIDLPAVAFELPDGTVRGDRIDFTPDSSVGRLEAMTDVVMVAGGVDGFRILEETAP